MPNAAFMTQYKIANYTEQKFSDIISMLSDSK